MSPTPSISAAAATRDQSEARTVRILIHSKRTASRKVVRWAGPRTEWRTVVMSGGLSGSSGDAVLDHVGGQFHECGLERDALRGQLVQPQTVPAGKRSDLLGGQTPNGERA